MPGDADYVTLFTKLAAAHELLGALADQDGGLFPQQKAALTAVGGEIRSLLEEQPGLGRVIDEAPPLRRLLRAAEVLNRTGHTNDRPPALFEGMQKDFWCVFWQAELMGADRDQGDWPAELHYQRGGCHLVRASVLNPLSVPEARRRELRNDPARLRQERDRLAARFVEELRLAAAAFRQALKTPAVTATPRLPLKARTFEATAAVQGERIKLHADCCRGLDPDK